MGQLIMTIGTVLNNAGNFEFRRTVERLREGLFDPFGVRVLTSGEEKLNSVFDQGAKALGVHGSFCQCISGAYGQGKSHSLAYIRQRALDQGFVVSYINLDPRQVPFHNFKSVYRSLMQAMVFPGEKTTFEQVWKARTRGKKCLEFIPGNLPLRFKAVLAAIAGKNRDIPFEKRKLKKHAGFKPREFSWILKNACMGKEIPLWKLKPALHYRQVDFYRQGSLTCSRPEQYLGLIPGMAELIQRIGFKGWVILFDEGESIVQSPVTLRSKSYKFLDQFFFPEPAVKGFYPVFAFTPDFFRQVQDEDYDREKTSRTGKSLYFEKDYKTAWKNIHVFNLHNLSTGEWGTLIEKLILIHAHAYLWQPQAGSLQNEMGRVLSVYNGAEPRLKLKLLVHHLDLAQQKNRME